MSRDYIVKYKNKNIGTIDVIELMFKPNSSCNPRFVPSRLRQAKTKNDILSFLESRIVQRDNQGIKSIIQDMGLETYNTISIINKTKGMDLNDCIWITSNPDEDYYDVHIRENPSKYIGKISL